jgi:hypothetical protein
LARSNFRLVENMTSARKILSLESLWARDGGSS